MAESALAKEPGLLGLLKKGSFRFVNNFIEPRDRMLVKDVSPVEHLAPQVDLDGWRLVLPVKRLLSTSFEDHHLVVTRDVMALRLPDVDTFDDIIPLHEVQQLTSLGDVDREEGSWNALHGLVSIKPRSDGYNMGRKYLLSFTFPFSSLGCEDQGERFTTERELVETLQGLVRDSKFRARDRSLAGRFARSRGSVRQLFKDVYFQIFVASLISANFAANAYEAQVLVGLRQDEGNTHVEVLETLDLFFTVIFTVELILNLYAHWMHDFIRDGWSLFDFLVVTTSLLRPFLHEEQIPVTVFRLLRAFRVLRLFGRLKSIRSIVNALSASLVPVFNAFFIMFIVMALYAIIGVSMYSTQAQEDFGSLEKAFITLFRIAAGETWVPTMPVMNEDGNVNWALGAYILSFILVANWTLLQVSVAVLLDNFVSETSREEAEERSLYVEEKRSHDSIGNPLDPLLKLIAREYVDNVHLDKFLCGLFQLLVNLGAGGTEGDESKGKVRKDSRCEDGAAQELTCQAFIHGLARLNLSLVSKHGGASQGEHHLHITEMDYNLLTEHGALAKANGAMGRAEFSELMRRQVLFYIKRKLQRSITETDSQHDFSTTATLRTIVDELGTLREKHAGVEQTLGMLNASVSHVSACVAALAGGGGRGDGGGGGVVRGAALDAKATADGSSCSEAKLRQKLEQDNEMLFKYNKALVEQNMTLMREVARLPEAQGEQSTLVRGRDHKGVPSSRSLAQAQDSGVDAVSAATEALTKAESALARLHQASLSHVDQSMWSIMPTSLKRNSDSQSATTSPTVNSRQPSTFTSPIHSNSASKAANDRDESEANVRLIALKTKQTHSAVERAKLRNGFKPGNQAQNAPMLSPRFRFEHQSQEVAKLSPYARGPEESVDTVQRLPLMLSERKRLAMQQKDFNRRSST